MNLKSIEQVLKRLWMGRILWFFIAYYGTYLVAHLGFGVLAALPFGGESAPVDFWLQEWERWIQITAMLLGLVAFLPQQERPYRLSFWKTLVPGFRGGAANLMPTRDLAESVVDGWFFAVVFVSLSVFAASLEGSLLVERPLFVGVADVLQMIGNVLGGALVSLAWVLLFGKARRAFHRFVANNPGSDVPGYAMWMLFEAHALATWFSTPNAEGESLWLWACCLALSSHSLASFLLSEKSADAPRYHVRSLAFQWGLLVVLFSVFGFPFGGTRLSSIAFVFQGEGSWNMLGSLEQLGPFANLGTSLGLLLCVNVWTWLEFRRQTAGYSENSHASESR